MNEPNKIPNSRIDLNYWLAVIILAMAIVAVFTLFDRPAHAAGSSTTPKSTPASIPPFKSDTLMTSTTITADAADASIPPVTFSSIGGKLLAVYFHYDDTTPPTTAFDCEIYLGSTAAGIDLLGGAGQDLATSADGYSIVVPIENISSEKYLAPFAGPITLMCGGNVVNSAIFTVYLLTTP